ncbi:UNVERIFIED_CONTAM: hypothetical protein PYX00_009568 [Menopon gallinae]|uniref:Uncharacterized protein n=1 Tax=Menopon gallinae TaxID=328185 RepID=A0AAW2HC40_9NEOP
MPYKSGKEAAIGKEPFPHRRKRSLSSQLDKLLLKYEHRNLLLQEKEATVRTRVEMMEAAMPVLLAWNMYQNCVEEAESSDKHATCPIWFSERDQEQLRMDSENDVQKRKNELDRLIREIRRRENLDMYQAENEDSSDDNAFDVRKAETRKSAKLEENFDEDYESLTSEEYV